MARSIAVLCLWCSGCVLYAPDRPNVVASEIVGTEGARIEGPGIALDVPAGALGRTTKITISVADEVMSRFERHSPIYRFEPEGLEFETPVRVEIDAAGAPLGSVVMWTRHGDPSVFEFAGFVEDGVGAAEVTHFSEGTVASACPFADGCPDDPSVPEDTECGDEGTGASCPNEQEHACSSDPAAVSSACAPSDSAPCGYEPCRSACRCAGGGSELCAVDPTMGEEYRYSNTRARCPETSAELGETIRVGNDVEVEPTSYDMLGEHNGGECSGWRIQTLYGVVCDCLGTGTSGYLCTRPWTPDPVSPTQVGCRTMLRDAASTMDAPEPMDDEWTGVNAFVAAVDETAMGLNADSYVGGACAGHWEEILPDGRERNGGLRRGQTRSCQYIAIGSHWVRETEGTLHSCQRFAFGEGGPGLELGQEEQTRCRLTEREWMDLQSRRGECGLPARSGSPDDKRTLAILRSEGTAELTGVNGRSLGEPGSQGSQRLRSESAAMGSCPAALPRTVADAGGERRFRGSGPTHCHAEGDVLEQLAVARGRQPPVGTPGDPWSQWGGEGGTIGGAAEILVDRAPCNLSCAPRGIDRMRQTAGLDEVTVRSPSGTRRYGNGLPPGGVWVD